MLLISLFEISIYLTIQIDKSIISFIRVNIRNVFKLNIHKFLILNL